MKCTSALLPVALLALIGFVLCVPRTTFAQGTPCPDGNGCFGLGELTAFEADGTTEITSIPAGDTFDLIFGLHVAGSSITPEPHPNGSLTFTFGSGTFVALLGQPEVSLPNFVCTGGTDGAPLTCTWDGFSSTGFSIVFGIRVQAPLVTSEIILPIMGTVDPYDATLGNIGVHRMQTTDLTVEAGEAPATDLETFINGPDEVEANAEYTYDVIIQNNGPNPSGTFTMSTNASETVLSGSLPSCAAESTVNLQCPDLGPLAPGESVTVTVTAQAGETLGNTFVSARWINDALDDTNPGNDIVFYNFDIVEPTAEADLSLACEQAEGDKQGEEIPVGSSRTYVCQVNNPEEEAVENASLAVAATPSNALPPEDIGIEPPDGWTAGATSVTTPALSPGLSGPITITVTFNQPGTIALTFFLSSDATDPNPGDNTFLEELDVVAPDLSVEIIGPDEGVAIPFSGAIIGRYPFTVKVENLSSAEATSEASETWIEKPSVSISETPSGCHLIDESGDYLICQNGVLEPGENIQFGLEFQALLVLDTDYFDRPLERQLNTFNVEVRPVSPETDKDTTNHRDHKQFRFVRPTEFVFLDPVPTVPSGVIRVQRGTLTNNTDEVQEATTTVFSTVSNLVQINRVTTEDGFCTYEEDVEEYTCTAQLGPEESQEVEVTYATLGEGTASVCARVAETAQEACTEYNIGPPQALPDLFVSPLELNPDVRLFGVDVIYEVLVTIGNKDDAEADSKDSELLLTSHLDIPPLFDLLPEGCSARNLINDEDEGIDFVGIFCPVGPLAIGETRTYAFSFLTPPDLIEPSIEERIGLLHEATITPLDPMLDRDMTDHHKLVEAEFTNSDYLLEDRAPASAVTNTPVAVPLFITNVTNQTASLQLDLTGSEAATFIESLTDAADTQLNGSTATQTFNVPENSTVQVGVVVSFNTAGTQTVDLRLADQDTEVLTQTLSVLLSDEPLCTVTKELLSDDATPPVNLSQEHIVTYRLTVSSNVTIPEVILFDEIPPNLFIPVVDLGPNPYAYPPPTDCEYIATENVEVHPALGAFPNAMECRFPLPAGQSRMFDFKVLAQEAGLATNVAEACGTSDFETIDVQALHVELDVMGANEEGVAAVGTPLTFLAKVTNVGSEPAPDVQATLTLDSYTGRGIIPIVFVRTQASNCVAQDVTAACNLGTLAPGETTEVTLNARTRQVGTSFLDTKADSGDQREADEGAVLDVVPRQASIEMANVSTGRNKQAAAVDIYLDGTRIADDLEPGSATAFLPLTITSSTPRVDMVDGDAPDNSAPLASFTADLVGAQADTLAFSEQTLLLLTDTPGDTLGLILKHHAQTTAADPAQADVFFVHASPDAPQLRLHVLNTTTEAATVAFGETSGYVSVAPAIYFVDVRNTDTGASLGTQRLDLTSSAGQAVALVLTGRLADGTFTLDAFDGQGGDVPSPIDNADDVPGHFVLHGNYPNPFNPTTTLRFDLPEGAEVRVEVFDVLGRRVFAHQAGHLPAQANHTLALDARSLASGMYVYRVVAEGRSQIHQATGRFVLVR